MHGIGNDYVYINCFEQQIDNPSELAKEMSPRRFSVGADGVILICPSEVADAKMRMFNLDGSEGKMCGNGIRCVGKFVYDNGIAKKQTVTVETLSGIKTLYITEKGGLADTITVDMGKAEFDPKKIPVITDCDSIIDTAVMAGSKYYNITAVSMGNPHAVTFCDEIDSLNLEEIGPHFEHHEIFPQGVNTEFIRVIDENTLQMRVWERGSGETFACGTGACAAVVAAVVNGYCKHDTEITVHLVGGDLFITYKSDGTVLMRGGATTVFDGIYNF
ncbi:MAG: diaminopimelate epimerase [Ruminococcaceae bacterium]|nr:diaminopimelate epimerase [Oscillospiraceae bacterium]